MWVFVMSLILCDEQCKYQVDGICSLEFPSVVNNTHGGCIYKTEIESTNKESNSNEANTPFNWYFNL